MTATEEGLTEDFIIPAESITADAPGVVYVSFTRTSPEEFALSSFECTLKFISKEVDPTTGTPEEEGYDDEYQVEQIDIGAGDVSLAAARCEIRACQFTPSYDSTSLRPMRHSTPSGRGSRPEPPLPRPLLCLLQRVLKVRSWKPFATSNVTLTTFFCIAACDSLIEGKRYPFSLPDIPSVSHAFFSLLSRAQYGGLGRNRGTCLDIGTYLEHVWYACGRWREDPRPMPNDLPGGKRRDTRIGRTGRATGSLRFGNECDLDEMFPVLVCILVVSPLLSTNMIRSIPPR